MDHWALVHCVRTVGAGGDKRVVRGGAELSGRVAAMENRGTAERKYFSHFADGDSNAAQGGSRRTKEIRFPFQAYDYGGGADRAGSVAMVLRGCRKGRSGE